MIRLIYIAIVIVFSASANLSSFRARQEWDDLQKGDSVVVRGEIRFIDEAESISSSSHSLRLLLIELKDQLKIGDFACPKYLVVKSHSHTLPSDRFVTNKEATFRLLVYRKTSTAGDAPTFDSTLVCSYPHLTENPFFKVMLLSIEYH